MAALRWDILVRREGESDGSAEMVKDSALAVKEWLIAAKNQAHDLRSFVGHPRSGVTCAAASSLQMAALEVHCLICSIGLYVFFCK